MMVAVVVAVAVASVLHSPGVLNHTDARATTTITTLLHFGPELLPCRWLRWKGAVDRVDKRATDPACHLLVACLVSWLIVPPGAASATFPFCYTAMI
ncbi:uncharacterized protein B0I36DRAFT_318230 [Microdochium trichocladiopsis]|uniref:Secreted peptide n=1 Tax=Microdochium trichocladiopsis TaxID=1682393 RepID=A0A9P9BSZ6_9PEZI|nr:uncharacterized protein B0I36DRAFT_318230 [Microdochium trichocladiopsis]KAH7035385.1 hypothetical protein B0I36DRAFT_318230 [Microdochium trichocladiopsis]